MSFQEIPKTWTIIVLFLGLCFLRWQGIDTFVTAGLSLLIGTITGIHLEQSKKSQ